jgi:HEAT repeat protein
MRRWIPTLVICVFAGQFAVADFAEDLIAGLLSDDGAVRRNACALIKTREVPPETISQVAALLDHDNPEIVRTAKLALEGIVAPYTNADGLREITGDALCDAIDVVENDGWLFWLLSYTGEENVAARIGGMFSQSRFDDVVLALEGIGGEASAKALVRQLTKSEDKERIALIQALGAVQGETAIAALLNQATLPDPVGLAAIEALGTIATPRALPIIESRLESEFSPTVFGAYLRTVQTIPVEDAVTAYENLLKNNADTGVQAAVLTGLAGTGTDAAIRALLTALYSDDPAIHGAARNGLVAIKSDTANRVLVAALKSAGPDTKGVMLEIVHARDPKAAAPLLDQALDDSDAMVQVSALNILAEQPNAKYEKTLREATKNGPTVVKRAALHAYLALASTLEDDRKQALRIYQNVFDLAEENEDRRAALEGMGRTGGMTTLIALQGYGDIPGMGDDIAECTMAIADRMAESNPSIAKRVYEGVALEGPVQLAQRAADSMHAMGIDRDFVREAGFLTEWKIIGPFPNEGIDKPAPPETEFKEDAEYVGAAKKTVRWTNVRTPHIRGILDLAGLLTPNENGVAYARTTFNIKNGGDALLLLGSDDGIACWLNGEKVHSNNANRGLAIDEDRVEVKLNAGENVLLLKITQRTGGWAFCTRITDSNRKPWPFNE